MGERSGCFGDLYSCSTFTFLHSRLKAYALIDSPLALNIEAKLLALLEAGRTIALVSDAGTPLISDPGYKLVAACHSRGVRVTATPGPAAPLMALTISGLPTDRFTFQGFVPQKQTAARAQITESANLPMTQIWFETPRRLAKTLALMAEIYGERNAAITRELTKLHETVEQQTLGVLAQKFADRTLNRRYIALVWGDLKEDEGSIAGHIGRSLKNRKVMSVFEDGAYGKHALTYYKVLERFGYTTLVECKLETGRTHQIRAHMKHIGHPLFNDLEYGGDTIVKGTSFTKYKQFVENCFKLLPGQALHAKSLGFYHPTLKKDLSYDSELPDYFEEVLNKWRRYSQSSTF